jgi:succinate dehydrogenase hydrophobic anchor subunit
MQATPILSFVTRPTIVLVALIQIALGLIFIASPGSFPALLGLPAAPAWTNWIFAMLGARALGFAFGMLVALRDLQRHTSWLFAMLVVQAIDWIATIVALHAGTVTLAQVSTASFLPILFIVVLGGELLRPSAPATAGQSQ